MRMLSIETSASEENSWALLEGEESLREDFFSGRASASLFPSLAKHLQDGEKIDRILVGIGPGSFSGIRVAIAAAQGLSLAWGCKVIAARSSGAVAYEFSHVSYLGVFAPARREEYFVTFYERGKLVRPTELVAASELEAALSKCSLAVSAEAVPGVSTKAIPKASALAFYFLKNGIEAGLDLEPVYIKSIK